MMESRRNAVFAQDSAIVEHMVAESVRIKAEVVTADERESGLRRILNFGHTFGHALEAETKYTRFLHGEAVSWGMRAATRLAETLGMLREGDEKAILDVLTSYGPIPSVAGIDAEHLQNQRLLKDKEDRAEPDSFCIAFGDRRGCSARRCAIRGRARRD